MELLLIKYGLLAAFLASLFEADVVPVLAGVAAHRGVFNSALGIIVASAGAFTGDCLWFSLGRYGLVQHWKRFRQIRSKAEMLFQRVGNWQIPASHVVYGTRVATMVLSGARGASFITFALVDGTSCLLLTTLLFSLGFALSASVSIILFHLKRIEFLLLVAVILVTSILHFVRRSRSRNLYCD